MRAKVLKAFSYSADGLRLQPLSPGDVLDIADDMALGLMVEGFIDEAVETPPPPPPAPERRYEHHPAHEGLHIKHIGRGKYAVMRGDERLTHDPLEKDEAESALADLLDARERGKELNDG